MATAAQIYVMVKIDTKTGCAHLLGIRKTVFEK
jgi:hypothetical protein